MPLNTQFDPLLIILYPVTLDLIYTLNVENNFYYREITEKLKNYNFITINKK